MLKNEKLWLMPANPEFSEALAAFYRKNRAFLQPYDPARDESFFTSDYQRQILEQEVSAWERKTSCRFYLFLPDQPEQIIGVIGLNNIVWGGFRSCFLGYKMDQDHVNQGYMTAAVAMVVEYAFSQLGLHRIEGNVMPENLPSRRVLEKCGFENEGLSRSYLQINGVWEDHIHMVKLNTQMHTSR